MNRVDAWVVCLWGAPPLIKTGELLWNYLESERGVYVEIYD